MERSQNLKSIRVAILPNSISPGRNCAPRIFFFHLANFLSLSPQTAQKDPTKFLRVRRPPSLLHSSHFQHASTSQTVQIGTLFLVFCVTAFMQERGLHTKKPAVTAPCSFFLFFATPKTNNPYSVVRRRHARWGQCHATQKGSFHLRKQEERKLKKPRRVFNELRAHASLSVLCMLAPFMSKTAYSFSLSLSRTLGFD